jgi:hypothetical protein
MCEQPSARARFGALASALAVASAVAVISAPNGLAADRPEAPEGSAVLQYVETVPTSAGPTSGGSGTSPSPSASPSQAMRKALATIVSSPRYGAPQNAPRSTGNGTSSGTPAPSVSRAFDAAADTFGPWSGARQVGVFAVLIVTTAGAVAMAARRRRL